MQQDLLPLFPLRTVLFPRTPLPLHIFEDRYKEMMGEVIPAQSEFGVVLANEKGICGSGCTAVVERVLKNYPDGRIDLLAAGRRRFEILLLNEEKQYLRGAVHFFDDEESDPTESETHRKVLAGFTELKGLETDEPIPEPELSDPQVSFQIAQSLPDLDFRQHLLVTKSEAGRMRQLAGFLEQFVVKRRQVLHIRSVAPRNGHGKWPPTP